MTLYGPNQLVTRAVQRATDAGHHQQLSSRVYPPVVVAAGPAFAFIVPTVYGKDGEVIHGVHAIGGGVGIKAVTTEPSLTYAEQLHDAVAIGTDVVLVIVMVLVLAGWKTWVWLVPFDPDDD